MEKIMELCFLISLGILNYIIMVSIDLEKRAGKWCMD